MVSVIEDSYISYGIIIKGYNRSLYCNLSITEFAIIYITFCRYVCKMFLLISSDMYNSPANSMMCVIIIIIIIALVIWTELSHCNAVIIITFHLANPAWCKFFPLN